MKVRILSCVFQVQQGDMLQMPQVHVLCLWESNQWLWPFPRLKMHSVLCGGRRQLHVHRCQTTTAAACAWGKPSIVLCVLFSGSRCYELLSELWPKMADLAVYLQGAQRVQEALDLNPEVHNMLAQCPRCRQRNLKAGRNNHIRCWSCNKNFCFLCKGSFSKLAEHFSATGCPQHSDWHLNVTSPSIWCNGIHANHWHQSKVILYIGNSLYICLCAPTQKGHISADCDYFIFSIVGGFFAIYLCSCLLN